MLDLRAQPRDRVLIDNADHTLGKRVADFRSEAARDKARAVRNAGMGPSGLDFHALRGHG